MDICENCFDSQIINQHIRKQGHQLNHVLQCSVCGNNSLYRYEGFKLALEVQNVIRRFYEHEWSHGLVASATMMAREEEDDISLYLPGLMTLKDICYELFNIDCDDKFYELLRDIETDGESEFDQDPDEETWLDMGCKWDGSNDMALRWEEFCENVKYGARFFDHEHYNRTQELSKLNKTFETLTINTSAKLFRARKIESEANITAIHRNPSRELGKAPKKLAGLNRFSPQGISYIYLANNKETACKEIRLDAHESYAVAEFEVQNLKLIDLRMKNLELIRQNPFSEKHTAELRCSIKYIEDFILKISQPVNEDEKYLDYIPTQIVSEYIWSLNYDGFIYDSSLSDGENYLLFDETYQFVNYEIINSI